MKGKKRKNTNKNKLYKMKAKNLLGLVVIAAITITGCKGKTSEGEKTGSATESTGDSNTPSSPSDTVRIIKDYYGNDNKNIWHEKRATWSTSASNGKGGWVLNGITKEYYQSPANTLASEATYVNGKREGLTTKYYPSGKKYIVWNYVAGRIDGIVTKYYENGKVQSETPYKNGLLGTGTKEYSSEGTELTMPELVVSAKDDRIAKGQYTIIARLVKGGQNVGGKVEFKEGMLIEGKYTHPNLKTMKKNPDGSASILYYESTGFPEYVNVVAEYTTSKGTSVLFSKPFTVK